jgi:hypothetical protein
MFETTIRSLTQRRTPRRATLLCALLAGCSAENPIAPHRDTQNGFTGTYSGAFVAGHVQQLTIRHAPVISNTLVVTLDSTGVAGIVNGSCAAAVIGIESRCLLRSSYKGDAFGLVCEDRIDEWVCTAPIYARVAGTFALTAVVGSDSATFHYPVDPQRATVVESATPTPRAQPNVAFGLRVRVLDQLHGLMHGVTPSATVSEPAAVVDSVTMTPPTDSATAVVWLRELKAGAVTVRVAMGGVSRDISVQLGAAADDSLVVVGAHAVLPVTQNDAMGAGSLRIARGPVHGTASVSGSAIDFTPATGFVGGDSIRYVVTAGGRSDTASAYLAVMGPAYVAGPLMTFSTESGEITRMNDSGQVAGNLILGDGTRRAFRWTGAHVDTLSSISRRFGVAGIDNAGNVVGFVNGQPVRWRPGAPSEEPVLPFAFQSLPWLAMSRGGTTLVGTSNGRAYLVRAGHLDSVQTTARFPTYNAVNDAGDFTGQDLTGSPYPHAYFHYASGSEKVFALGGRGFTQPIAINNRGIVVGYAEANPIGSGSHPISYDGNTVVDLTVAYGKSVGFPIDINDDGRILTGATGGPVFWPVGRWRRSRACSPIRRCTSKRSTRSTTRIRSSRPSTAPTARRATPC